MKNIFGIFILILVLAAAVFAARQPSFGGYKPKPYKPPPPPRPRPPLRL